MTDGIEIVNVVFDAPYAGARDVFAQTAGSVAALYSELLGMPMSSRADFYRSRGFDPDENDESDPVVARADGTGIGIAFEWQSDGYEHPRWPDPRYPQQMHLDIFVGDLKEADALVRALGAAPLRRRDGGATYADAGGHPLCLYERPGGVGEASAPGRIGRILYDCADPQALAAFYTDFFDMRVRAEDADGWIAIAHESDAMPMLAFQRCDHTPPRFPDPAYPEQVHLDLGSDDADGTRERALALGAVRLVATDYHHVLADPAGHPFCI
jgi:hypothetical protein